MTEPTSAELPPPPRPITTAARRQAWREPSVRGWLLLGGCVALVAVVVAWRNVRDGFAERQLLRDGVQVPARIEQIAGQINNVDRATVRTLTLSFQLPDEADRRTVTGPSRPTTGMFSTRDTIPVWVDPHDPTRWTDVAVPASWGTLLAVPLLFAPFALVLLGLGWRRQGRLLAAYRDGAATRGSVTGTQTSPLAPGQKRVRVRLDDGRAVTVTRPDRLGPVAPGDAADVLVSGREAVLAAAYA